MGTNKHSKLVKGVAIILTLAMFMSFVVALIAMIAAGV